MAAAAAAGNSQHTQAVDSRHRVAVPQQIAAVAAVLAQPPLALLFADGPVVDGQVLHLHLAGGSLAALLGGEQRSSSTSFFPFSLRLCAKCREDPSSWSQTSGWCCTSLTSNLSGRRRSDFSFVECTCMCRPCTTVSCVWVCVTAGSDLVGFFLTGNKIKDV